MGKNSSRAHRMGRHRPAKRGALAILVPLLLGACQSTPAPTPDQMSRNISQTAPADLQLLCANAVARSGGTGATQILPVSSRRLDARTYQVELNAAGRTMTCVVDDDGRVQSVGAPQV